MRTPSIVLGSVAMTFIAGSVTAETMRSGVAFNTAIQQLVPEQPQDGIAMKYLVTLIGGELDGCKAQIAESLFPRDNGNWGIFQVEADVACGNGAFSFASSGSWDANGFHGSGRIDEESGTGRFENLKGRVAQIGGKLTPAATAGTFDIGYELIVDRTHN